jgi:hypothetical protein
VHVFILHDLGENGYFVVTPTPLFLYKSIIPDELLRALIQECDSTSLSSETVQMPENAGWGDGPPIRNCADGSSSQNSSMFYFTLCVKGSFRREPSLQIGAQDKGRGRSLLTPSHSFEKAIARWRISFQESGTIMGDCNSKAR